MDIWYYMTIFVSEKVINDEMKTRKTLNGTEWVIETGVLGSFILMMKGMCDDEYRYSGMCFTSYQEAEHYLDKVDERYQNEANWKPCYSVPADYYGVAGRYYGD